MTTKFLFVSYDGLRSGFQIGVRIVVPTFPYVCGSSPTMKQAQRQAYNRVKNVMFPHMYYRDDIGERWSEDSDRLHAWGYLREA